MTENPGGIESFILNYYKKLQGDEFIFDFLANSYNDIAYEKFFKDNGSKIFHICSRSKNLIKYKKELNTFFKCYSKDYYSIWVNVCSLANIDYLKMAKKYGIRKRIIHSHNSKNMDSNLRGILHQKNKACIKNYATDFWACSEEAAKWFYDSRIYGDCIIIHNAINVKDFLFDENYRKVNRQKYNLDNKFVLGNIGRLHFQKNQTFLIDIFHELKKESIDAKLIIVGEGEDEKILKKKVRELNLEEDIIFTGIQYNISEWLSTFDFFLFPSIFEGLPLSLLEAQANGLPIIASEEAISSAAIVTKNLYFYSLNKTSKDWAKMIMKLKNKRLEEEVIFKSFKQSGYDINTETKKLMELLK